MAKKPKKTPKKNQLVEKLKNTEEAKARAVKRIEADLKKLYRGYFAEVKALIASDKTLRKTDALTLQATTKMMGDLTEILDELGFRDIVRTYGSQFEPLAKVALEYYEPFGLEPSLAGVTRDSLEAYVRFAQSEFAAAIPARLVSPIQSALLLANFGQMDRDQLIDQVTTVQSGITPNQAVVLVDDAFSQFQRTVVATQGDRLGMDLYQYLGPDDEITSPQCQTMLHIDRHGAPGILYKDEIDTSLHPNLRRNPLVGGGHVRCRHVWSPITEAYAKEQYPDFEPRGG